MRGMSKPVRVCRGTSGAGSGYTAYQGADEVGEEKDIGTVWEGRSWEKYLYSRIILGTGGGRGMPSWCLQQAIITNFN